MNASIYRISLDIHKAVSQTQIDVVKDDNKRQFIFTLYEDGKPFVLGNDCTAVFRAKKPDGTTLYNNCTIVDNTIVYDLTNQTTAAEGIVECEVTLYSLETVNGEAVSKQITSPRFTMRVASNLDNTSQVESDNEFTKLQEALGQVTQALDETNNLNITATKEGHISTVTVTHKDGTTNSVSILDGEKGDKGDKGVKGDAGVTPLISASASVDSTTGTPGVEVTEIISSDHSNVSIDFAFSGLKGEKGDTGETGATGATPSISASASVDGNTGTPSVNVTKSGTDANPSFAFAFSNLKGAKGDTGAKGDKGDIVEDITPYVDYTVDSQTNEVTITNLKSGVTPSSLIGRFRIPDTITIDSVARTVTTIGTDCFNNCVDADFILPSTLIMIQSRAFRNTNISEVNLNRNVTIEGNAFASCQNIKNVFIPCGTQLSSAVFSNCYNIKSVEAEDGNTTMGQNTFVNCNNLKYVKLPESITNLGNATFGSTSLMKLYIPKNVNSITINAFSNPIVPFTDIYFGGKESEWNNYNVTSRFNWYQETITLTGGSYVLKQPNPEESKIFVYNSDAKVTRELGVDYTYDSTTNSIVAVQGGNLTNGDIVRYNTTNVPTIHYNCKPAILQDIYDYHDSTKQDTLTAGTNITIENNVISASGGGGGTVDQTYDPTSTNAQSGTAVAGAVADKLTEPSSNLAVGKYFRVASIDAEGHAVLECVDAPTAPVQSISAAGTALMPDANGNVDIPKMAYNVFGIAKLGTTATNKFVTVDANGTLDVVLQSDVYYLKNRDVSTTNYYRTPLGTQHIGAIVKYALCGKNRIGYQNNVPVTTESLAWVTALTDAERLQALEILGCTVDSNGFVKWTAQS